MTCDTETVNQESSPEQDNAKNRDIKPHAPASVPKEHEMLNVVEEGVKGVVKVYYVVRRFGYISRSDGKGDVFVHQSAIVKSNMNRPYLRTLAKAEEVEFDIVETKKGLEAINVSGPNGDPVIGSHMYFLQFFWARQAFDEMHKKSTRLPPKDALSDTKKAKGKLEPKVRRTSITDDEKKNTEEAQRIKKNRKANLSKKKADRVKKVVPNDAEISEATEASKIEEKAKNLTEDEPEDNGDIVQKGDDSDHLDEPKAATRRQKADEDETVSTLANDHGDC